VFTGKTTKPVQVRLKYIEEYFMRGHSVHKKTKWYHHQLVERVILPLIFTAVALYVLVILKHWGLIS
jgi:hypothetical protein